LSEPEKLTAVVDYLNKFLPLDGLELQRQRNAVKLAKAGRGTPVIGHLATKVDFLDFDTVRRDLDRALTSSEYDPEDAVTAACSVIESMCRSVLMELGLALPAKKDISGLYRAVREPLGLAPERSDLPPQIADDVRKVLSGLTTAVEGIGALRTHAGDAHGQERGSRRIDSRIASLAIHTASTVTLCVLETWQQKFPTKPLKRH
jgi:Abortive infection C-terminus